MTSIKVALAQICSGADPAANLALVERESAAAAGQGARLVIFPEATMRCFGLPLAEIAEPLDGPWASGVRALAERLGIVVVVGMFTPADDGRVYNTLLATGPGVEAHYDKIHLYDAFGFAESDTVAPGAEPVTVLVDGVVVGLTTCYDVRFPGLYTRLASDGAELVAVATSWGAGPGKVDQWEVLTRARALDSTCFVLAAGQADPEHSGQPTRGNAPTGVGGSTVVSPNGTVLAALGPEPGLLVVDCDLEQIPAARRSLPVLANRRF